MNFLPKIYEYLRLVRLDKPIGILLLLWPTLWALWLAAKGPPPWKILLIFMSGVVIMRSAGDIINDIADRRIDGSVTRTRNRPLVTQTIPLKNAWALFIALCLLAGILVLFLNTFSLYLAFIGLLLACLYPFTKRFTHWPQAFLALAYSWGIPMAFAALQNQLSLLTWWLFATAGLWVILYDTFYAMTDRPDDIKMGIKSTAVLFGDKDKIIIGCFQVLVLISLILIGIYCQLHWPFYLGIVIAGLLAIYQQYLIRRRDPVACFKAFLNNHWFGCAVFIGLFFSF